VGGALKLRPWGAHPQPYSPSPGRFVIFARAGLARGPAVANTLSSATL
jgi:hypothetical protein